jgi:xylulokinase
VKGLLLGVDGEILATTTREVPVQRHRPEWAEIAAESWWQAIGAVTRTVIARAPVAAADVTAMAIVAMRDPIVLTDDDEAVLRPSILWTDTRTLPQVRALAEKVGVEHLIDVCGTVPVVGLSAPTALWHQEHEPELWARVAHIRLVKDWIVWRLTGVDQTDESSITRSMLNDARTRTWSSELLDAAGVQRDQLATVIRRPTDVLGILGEAGARALGLHPEVLVVSGGGDDPAAALGAGAVEVDSICIGTGTASDFRRVAAAYEPDHRGRRDSTTHLVPDREIVAATIDGTGTSLRWFRDVLHTSTLATAIGSASALPLSTGGDGALGPESFDALTALAASVEPGATGLSFFPYIAGQRAPRYLPDSSGVFFGLRAGHTPAHMVRAILEGVAFQYPATLEILGIPPGAQPAITMIDGETRSPLWNQIKADVLGVPIHVPAVAEAAALGAAMVAGMGAGAFPTAQAAVSSAVRPGTIFAPDPERHEIYRELRARYERIHDCLAPAFEICASPVVNPSHRQRSLDRV